MNSVENLSLTGAVLHQVKDDEAKKHSFEAFEKTYQIPEMPVGEPDKVQDVYDESCRIMHLIWLFDQIRRGEIVDTSPVSTMCWAVWNQAQSQDKFEKFELVDQAVEVLKHSLNLEKLCIKIDKTYDQPTLHQLINERLGIGAAGDTDMSKFARNQAVNSKFLEGTACLGKTSILTRMKELGENVGFLDYYNYVHGRFDPSKFDRLILQIGYIMWYAAQRDKYDIIDRTPVSGITYKIVFSTKQVGDNFWHDIVPIMIRTGILQPNKTIVLVSQPGCSEEMVARMVARNNGLDLMTREYVEMQDDAFSLFSKFFSRSRIVIDLKDSVETNYERVRDAFALIGQ